MREGLKHKPAAVAGAVAILGGAIHCVASWVTWSGLPGNVVPGTPVSKWVRLTWSILSQPVLGLLGSGDRAEHFALAMFANSFLWAAALGIFVWKLGLAGRR